MFLHQYKSDSNKPFNIFLHKKIFFFHLSSFKQDNSIIIMRFSNWPCYVGANNTKLIIVIKLLAVPVFYVLSVLLSPAEYPCLLQTFKF